MVNIRKHNEYKQDYALHARRSYNDLAEVDVVPEKAKRMSFRPALWVSGGSAVACALIWTGWGIHLYWNDVRLVNFLAAWIPFVLSILLAFVPEHKMTSAKKFAWRSSVILAGFIWSVVLWHQQVVTDATSRTDQERIVASAVNKANEHSDPKIEAVQREVKGVKTDVGGVKSDLKDTKDAIANMVSKSEKDITISLSKVGKPDPPELTELQVSLWDDKTDLQNFPILSKKIVPDADGIFSIEWTFRNISGPAAENLDVWINLCSQCSFAAEPVGYNHPAGEIEQSRHRAINLLNPGTAMEKSLIKVRVNGLINQFPIGFSYSCRTCVRQLQRQQYLTIINGIGLNIGNDTNKPTLKLP